MMREREREREGGREGRRERRREVGRVRGKKLLHWGSPVRIKVGRC